MKWDSATRTILRRGEVSAVADNFGRIPDGSVIRQRMADAVRRCPRLHGCVKLLARATGKTNRAAEKQLNCENAPSLASVIGLISVSDEAIDELLALAGREDVIEKIHRERKVDDLLAKLNEARMLFGGGD